MTERKVYCGDVDGEGTECVFHRRAAIESECTIDIWWYSRRRNPHPCHVPNARLAALAKQDGEMVKMVREALDAAGSNCTLSRSWYNRARAALEKRGVDNG